jgi:hypothetical protein
MPTYRMESADWQPARYNELHACLHWAQRQRLKQRDADMIGVLANNHDVPAAEGKRSVRLVIVMAPRQRAGDPDAYDKSLLDGLVQCGLLKDDNRQWCVKRPTEYVRGEKAGCVIVLEDIP